MIAGMSVRSGNGARRPLPPAFAARIWQPGQFGNLAGKPRVGGTVIM
jgi:hypothetical protein